MGVKLESTDRSIVNNASSVSIGNTLITYVKNLIGESFVTADGDLVIDGQLIEVADTVLA